MDATRITPLELHEATPPARPGGAAEAVVITPASTLAELRPFAAAWDELAAAGGHRVPTPSHAFVAAYLEHGLEPGERWRCLLATTPAGELVGVLPLVARPERAALGGGTRLAIPSGNHFYSADAVFAPGQAAAVWPQLLVALPEHFPDWTALFCERLAERSPTLAASAALDGRCLHAVEPGGHGTIVDTRGELATYMGSLHASFARNLARFERKLARLPGAEVTFLQGPAARPELIGEFMELEASGWKGTRGGAILRRASLVAYYAALVGNLAARGWLEWHLVRVDQRLIAAHLACRMGPCVFLWKIAFDEEFKPYAPGNVLFLKTVERAFADPGVDEVNCLTDTYWGHNWNMTRRPYYDLSVWPRRLLPALVGWLPRQTRQAMRRVPGARPLVQQLRRLAARVSRPRPEAAP